MNAHTHFAGFRAIVIAGVLALVSPLSGRAADNAPPETLNVKVFRDHYVAAGKPFTDLAALEAWARPIVIRSVWLDFCFPASTPQLVATVERIHSRYSAGLQVRTLSGTEEECVSAAAQSSSTQANGPIVRADADSRATAGFSRGKLP